MENNNLVTAQVIYKDVDAGNKPVYHKLIAGKANSPVHFEQYKRYIPKNFTFEGYGRFNRALRNHDVDVIYVREHHAPAQGHIMVDYINSNNQLINRNTFTSQVGSRFDVNKCKSTIPKNYQFKQIVTGSGVNVFRSESQIMVVQVSRIKRFTITVKYLDHGTQIKQARARGIENSAFNVKSYVHDLPKGYQFVKIDGIAPEVFKRDQVVNIDVTKKATKKPRQASNASNNDQHDDPKKIGDILMRLASSLHALGETISKSNRF